MLFRRQVIKKRQDRLYGAVIISTPLTFWIVASFLVCILGTAVGFSAISSFARVEPVRGVIVPSGGIAIVRAASGGLLSGFSLAEGEIVTAGQTLGQITDDGAIAGEGTRLAAEIARIDSHIVNLRSLRQQNLAIAGIEIAALSHQEERIQNRITRLNTLLDLRRAAAAETRTAFDRMFKLTEREFASKRQLSAERLKVIAAEQRVVELESELVTLAAELRELPRRQTEIEARTQLTVLEIQLELDNLVAERTILSADQSFAVSAPVEGRVSAVRARNGHEVRQGETLFSILPMERSVEVELYIPSRAIGFVEPGLSVRLLLDAYPYQRFGTVLGEVIEITTTVLQPGLDDASVQIQEPVFRAVVALESNYIEHDGTEHSLQVGMTLTGNIILEERTILSRVIEPVVSVMSRY